MKKEKNNKSPIIALLLLASSLIASVLLSPFAGLLLNATGPSNSVVANVVVPPTCFAQVSNTAINFGSLAPTASYAPTNLVVDDNSNGNVKANILVEGTSWSSLTSNTFGVTNTVWSPSSNGGANALTGSPIDTLITVPKAGSAGIYFGVNIPAAQNADIYAQTITVESSC